MTELEIVWLAAYLEGEGCFTWLKRKQGIHTWGYPCIMVGATDLDVIQKASKIMASCKPFKLVRYDIPGKPMYRTQIGGKRSLAIMGLILPHMGKRRSARIKELFKLSAARPGHARGEKHYEAKLTWKSVREMRTSPRRFERGFKAKMCRKHHVTWNTICEAANGTTWKDRLSTKMATLTKC